MSAGHVHRLIGPNGAGKSTLFKMLTGQLRHSARSIRLRGIDITDRSTNATVNLGVGIKMQTPQLFETEPRATISRLEPIAASHRVADRTSRASARGRSMCLGAAGGSRGQPLGGSSRAAMNLAGDGTISGCLC
ncbi:ATP-binding cassette domain-containing protein [Bradyrhizobium sp.]|uniref:ATP-binding cassette domain-containing protein n=1 Tax=Bradyrhizobium sp. TaxID=376 RepID=UPI0035A0DE43